MRKLPYIILGMLLVIGALILIGEASAGPKQCPPGQRDECDFFVKAGNPDQFGCFPEWANLGNAWIFVSDKCPKGKEKKKDSTNTPQQVTNTQKSPTDAPTNGDPPKDPKNKTATVTLQVLYVDSPEAVENCPKDCICIYLGKIAEELEEGNELKKTEINLLQTQVSK